MQRLRDFLKRLNDTDLVDFSEPETGRAISTGYRKKADVLEWFAEEQLDIVGIYKCVDNRDGTYKAYMKGVFTDAPAESDFDDYVSFCYAEQDETKMPMPKPKEIKEHTDMETPQELFDVKDVFTSVNAQDAKAYVNSDVFLSSSLAGLRENVAKNRFVTLDCILDDDNDRRFVWDDMEYSLCLPSSKVKCRVTDKKYRPFKDLAEIKEVTGFQVGSSVKLKVFTLDRVLFIESETLIIDMDTTYSDLDGSVLGYKIYLGTADYTLEELLSHFEYLNPKTNEWQPFGVPEDER